MSFELDIEKEQELLNVHVQGTRTTENIILVTEQIIDEFFKNDCLQILMDVRDFEKQFGTPETYFLATTQLPPLIQRRIKKVAVVEDKDLEYNAKFYEDVVRHRGYDFRIFTDMEEAKHWLE
jgi:hypothetical protein